MRFSTAEGLLESKLIESSQSGAKIINNE